MLLSVSGLAKTAGAQTDDGQCELAPLNLNLKFDSEEFPITLPMKGAFVQESHYLTTLDLSFGGPSYPKPMNPQPDGGHATQCDQNVWPHLERSLQLYREFDSHVTLNELYPTWWDRVWTPMEAGGQCGQGSIGDDQLTLLTPEKEMWIFTMAWAPGHKPKPDTRFLLSYDGRSVVALAGYETGPDVPRFLGGVSSEIHHWLGSDNNTDSIVIGFLKDQSLVPGPIDCAVTVNAGHWSGETIASSAN